MAVTHQRERTSTRTQTHTHTNVHTSCRRTQLAVNVCWQEFHLEQMDERRFSFATSVQQFALAIEVGISDCTDHCRPETGRVVITRSIGKIRERLTRQQFERH